MELERVSVVEEAGVGEGNAHVAIMEGVQQWVMTGLVWPGHDERWEARLWEEVNRSLRNQGNGGTISVYTEIAKNQGWYRNVLKTIGVSKIEEQVTQPNEWYEIQFKRFLEKKE